MHARVVVITGAAGGIGASIAKSFLEAGDKVIILDLKQVQVDATVSELNSANASGYVCDVTQEDQVQQVFKTVHQQHGSIDVLVNNAGLQHVSPIEDFPTDKFRYMVEVMLTAPFIAIKNVLPYMKQQKSGRIINMASVNGLIGFAGKAAYNSAKHGLIGLTKVTALETATHGITVNAVCPGYVDTSLVRNQLSDLAKTRGISLENVLAEVIYPLVPQKRLLDVAEVANMVLFLSDEKSGGITGQAMVVDGGYTTQ